MKTIDKKFKSIQMFEVNGKRYFYVLGEDGHIYFLEEKSGEPYKMKKVEIKEF